MGSCERSCCKSGTTAVKLLHTEQQRRQAHTIQGAGKRSGATNLGCVMQVEESTQDSIDRQGERVKVLPQNWNAFDPSSAMGITRISTVGVVPTGMVETKCASWVELPVMRMRTRTCVVCIYGLPRGLCSSTTGCAGSGVMGAYTVESGTRVPVFQAWAEGSAGAGK